MFHFFLLVVISCDEKRLDSDIAGQPCVSTRLTKCINLPADGKPRSQIFKIKLWSKERLPCQPIIQQVIINRTCFIRCWPSSIDKFQLPILDQLPHLLLLLLRLLKPPHLKELNLSHHPRSIIIFQQLLYRRRNNIFNLILIQTLVVNQYSIIIFIQRVDPAKICVRMRKVVNIYLVLSAANGYLLLFVDVCLLASLHVVVVDCSAVFIVFLFILSFFGLLLRLVNRCLRFENSWELWSTFSA